MRDDDSLRDVCRALDGLADIMLQNPTSMKTLPFIDVNGGRRAYLQRVQDYGRFLEGDYNRQYSRRFALHTYDHPLSLVEVMGEPEQLRRLLAGARRLGLRAKVIARTVPPPPGVKRARQPT